jgi:predicted TIM-barrel fold metal-dependent hydrolase
MLTATSRGTSGTLACQQAYNDWVADYCKVAPGRLRAMATIPIQDIGLAVAETRRAVEELGLLGVMLRSASPSTAEPFNHPMFDHCGPSARISTSPSPFTRRPTSTSPTLSACSI